MGLWTAGGLIVAATIGWSSYAPHVVLAHRLTYATSSISLPYPAFTHQFHLRALHHEAKLIDSHARRLRQPLNLLHPGVLAHTAQAWAQSVVELVTAAVCSPSSDASQLRRLGAKALGLLLGSLASFPFFIAQNRLFAQLAGEVTVLPLKYTGLGQTLSSINYADTFRYAFIPHLLTSVVSDAIYSYYSPREETIANWIYRKLPPFKSRSKKVNKTKRLIASAASNILFSVLGDLVLSPLYVVSTTMAIQGSGLEVALGTPRYSSGLHCAEDIFVRHGPLAFWQGLVPVLYSELVPQAMATTFTALVFNAFAYHPIGYHLKKYRRAKRKRRVRSMPP